MNYEFQINMRKKMFYSFFFLFGILISSCSENIKTSKKIKFWYEYYRQSKFFTSDTFSINKIHQSKTLNTFIISKGFTFKNKDYGISMFTNEPDAPVDGSEVYYELNNFGIIYSRSNIWQSYGVLKSNSDSINAIINCAIENILVHEDLRCFRYDKK